MRSSWARRSEIVLAGVASLGLMAMMVGVAVRYPGNHAAGPGAYVWLFSVLLAASVGLWVATRRPPMSLIVLVFVGMLLVWLVDARNTVVDYEEWVGRGMPAWGERQGQQTIP